MTITLKIPEYSDYAHIYPTRFTPEVVYWADDELHQMSVEEYAENRLWAQNSGEMFERIIVRDDEPIGTITARDFNPSTHQCVFGIVIADKTNWGHGYGTEAMKLFLPLLKEEGVKIVILDTYSSNKRAQKCFMHLGFRKMTVYYAPNSGRFVLRMGVKL